MELDEFIELVKEQQGIDLSGVLTTADKIARPQSSLDRDAFDDFNVRNPMAGGGMLVQPSADGSRPGYANPDPKVATKEFIEQRDKGKGIPTVREYLRKVLRRKDSINFKDIADIKKKAGLPKNAKIDSDISRLINTEEFKDKVTTDLKNKQLGQTETFRNILRDIKKTIPKGNKQFINVSYIAKKYEIPGKPDSGGFYRVLQEPEFANTFVGLTQDTRSNPQIIRFAEEFERLYEISDVDEDFFRQLAINIYGNDKPKTIRAVGADASKYAEFLYGVREVTDANGNKLKLPNVEKRGDYLFELIDETLALQEGEKGKVKPITYDQGIVRDRMFAIRDGLLGLKEGQTELQRTNIKKLLKKGYNLDEVAGLAATHEIAPGYTELVQGLKKKVNADKMVKIDKPFSRIFEQVITGQKPTKGYKYGNKFYQNINEVVKLYNKDAAAYGKKYGIDVPLIEYKPGKKIDPKNFLPNFKYLSPEAKANVQDLARQGVGVRTEALTMSQLQDAGNPNLKTERAILNKIQSYSKLPKCKVNLKADGGRIGFANSIDCIKDGLKEQKIEAQKGNKKAAQELVQVGKVATRAGLLKNLLGPGAILGELVFEGALIGNKILGGKPADIAYAESYLSYLDPRKYSGQLDPLKMYREDMLESTADKNILQSGFDAQDRISAFNEARREEELAEIRQRPDQLMTEAEREKLRAYEKQSSPFIKDSQLQKDADIISSEAFKDASNIAQEYIQGQEGQRMFPYNQFKQSIGRFESGENRDYRRRKEEEMKNLYTQFSDNQLMDMLENSKSLKAAGITPEQYMLLLGAGTKRITPAVTRTLSGLDAVRTDIQEQEALNRIAKAGGVANLARGGRAGFKLGKLIKLKKSKVREDAKAIIDDSMKMQQEIDTTTELDKLIKKTLDEDLFDKKDRIVDSINISEAKKRRNYPYNMQVFEEPKNLDFYRDIKESDFRTKTGPYYDRIRRNKAGGGLLKLAGDRSGPPPESGPNSQGLQGLLNRVKNT